MHGEAIRLDRRLVSLMRQIARAVRNTPLASEADQREVMTGTKAMRAALVLREFDSWDTELLHDEGTVLGIRRAGQSDDAASPPHMAFRTFSDWAHKFQGILDLVDTSPDAGYLQGGGTFGDGSVSPRLCLYYDVDGQIQT
jgi:hypothetical protein